MRAKTARRSRRDHRRSRQAGLSIVEVLIAALLFLVIMLGTLPLFTQAMTNNVSGGQSTTIGTDAKDQLERYYQVGFDDPLLNPGQTIQLRTLENHDWVTSKPAGETLRTTRTTNVRQYHFTALDDGILDYTEKLDSDANDFWVSLKEIEVAIDGEAQGALASTQSITHRVYKSQ